MDCYRFLQILALQCALGGVTARRMLTYADVCWRVLTYALQCALGGVTARLMRTYADVCWRVLTYADVFTTVWVGGSDSKTSSKATATLEVSWLWGLRWIIVMVVRPTPHTHNRVQLCAAIMLGEARYADVMLTYAARYADVCWHMLTYTHTGVTRCTATQFLALLVQKYRYWRRRLCSTQFTLLVRKYRYWRRWMCAQRATA
jgi:hypothetical protein